MNTIRRINNKLCIVATVRETVIIISKQPGRYTIADIKNAINNQLPSEEFMSETIVKRALATILDSQKKLPE